MVDAFAESEGICMNTVHCKAIFGQGHFHLLHLIFFTDGLFGVSCEVNEWYNIPGFVGDAPVLLAKPQTYMNLSGESVSYWDMSFSIFKMVNLWVLCFLESST